ncbi:ArsR/SmtB family transcription factor [Jeotgalibaca sp. A127]|uniref:ArsR/SmtB family transcription factor n=1 Tax=Jeotgalibaca sp. A127 TaxID=3457324 RepID=UPI003FCF293A
MLNQMDPEITNQTIKMFKILGDKTRFRILYLLETKEWHVNAIADALEMEQSAVSHQLRKLKEAKLVKSRRVGKNILYSQEDSHVYDILHLAMEHAAHTH